ncbi:MAG: hypothetical protein KAU06_09155 [Candidatus Marinimicrobia bacterium]|nr:hypothetical protein [Candidatus Neomarinimicrobiota bacterium]
MRRLNVKYCLSVVVILFTTSVLLAWSGDNHRNIIKSAFDTLSKREQGMFGSAADSVIEHYCLNPNNYRWVVRFMFFPTGQLHNCYRHLTIRNRWIFTGKTNISDRYFRL